MPSRLDYARLLSELEKQDFATDNTSILEWLREQGDSDRLRRDSFVPDSLASLESALLPEIQSGDMIGTPIITVTDYATIPSYSELESPAQAAHTIVLERDVRASDAIIAGEQIVWYGGLESELCTLAAPRIEIKSPPGRVSGGIWCDKLAEGENGAHLPASLHVSGVVVVEQPDGELVVGHGAKIGTLVVQGTVRTEYGVTISRLDAQGGVRLGRDNRIGSVEAASVRVERNSRIGTVLSGGLVHLGANCVVESIRASGDITFDADVTVTGDCIESQYGTFHIPAGGSWVSLRDHWFYALPDQTLFPFSPDTARPEESTMLALRSLTHFMLQQSDQVRGRNA